MARTDDRLAGTVKRLVKDKGFGFITPTRGGDVFFHRSALEAGDFERLEEGDAVTFVYGQANAKGPRAESVQIAE